MKESYIVPDPLGAGTIEVLKNSYLLGSKIPPRRGKVRDVYDLGDHLLIVTTDRISAFDVVYPTLIPHKGESLHSLSVYWFKRTADIFPNHFQEYVDSRAMKVLKAERIDVEWVCRAYLYGSAWRSYRKGVRIISGIDLPNGLTMAEELPEIILTPTTKSETGHDLELSKSEAIDSGLLSSNEWNELEEATYKLFNFYQREARKQRIIVPDFKLEFGRFEDSLIQIDEPPTHDSARFWAEKYYRRGEPQEAHCLDKEFLREYLRRIGYFGNGKPPEIISPIVCEISKRCKASFQVLTGKQKLAHFDLKTVDEVMEEQET